MRPTLVLVSGLVLSPLFSLAAQTQVPPIPEFHPVNPMAQSRSGVFFQPWEPPERGWPLRFLLDYGSAIEMNTSRSGEYLLDAELLVFRAGIRHDLGPRTFVAAEVPAGYAWAGFLDGFFDWYHGLLGIDIPARDLRPRDSFAYRVDLPGVGRVAYSPGAYLGDIRLAAGLRHRPGLQTVISLTLPTATRMGYGRGVPSLALMTTLEAPLGGRWDFTGGLGAGFTPRHGPLGPWQRTAFGAFTTGARWRIWGRQALYANFFFHSPYYHRTGYPALDRFDVSLNYGWLLRTAGGLEWRVGMTEDPSPSGPAIDAIFQVGVGR